MLTRCVAWHGSRCRLTSACHWQRNCQLCGILWSPKDWATSDVQAAAQAAPCGCRRWGQGCGRRRGCADLQRRGWDVIGRGWQHGSLHSQVRPSRASSVCGQLQAAELQVEPDIALLRELSHGSVVGAGRTPQHCHGECKLSCLDSDRHGAGSCQRGWSRQHEAYTYWVQPLARGRNLAAAAAVHSLHTAQVMTARSVQVVGSR